MSGNGGRVWMAVVAAALALAPGLAAAQQPTKVVFTTNWYAEAEHGGFYQALAEGIYARNGLDVEVKMGGPQINVMQLLLAGQADLIMGYDLQTIKAIEQGLPVVTVAATFQKDPAVLIAHPGVAQLADLKSRTLLIGQASETTFWPWLKSRYGFTDAQKRPYAFSVQQFLVDQNVAQQGYLTSEPYTIEKGGISPVVFLLADSGYPPYAETIVVTTKTLKEKPDMILRFVRASAEGWKAYLNAPAAGNALIRKANPEMTEELLAYGVAKMKQYGLVTGGDAGTLGILTMTDVRWKQTFDFMVSAGLAKPEVDYHKAYTLQFVKQIKVLP
ncbi:MAG TPA: ABC transporter substrate-binding protein [Burkholderiales bacterium]|nr:ABC transporter substrate-binding protein [Burkholderiales bacterium]